MIGNASLLRSLGFGASMALLTIAGCEPVDDGAATRAKGWDGVLTDNVLDGDRPVFLDIDETVEGADACAKDEQDVVDLLDRHCASCHDLGPASSGVPKFDFVMDLERLQSETLPRQGQADQHFIAAGDPDNSLIYIRVAVKRDMPPLYHNVAMEDPPRVSFSEGSVLREWIEKCLGPAPTASGTGGP
jgi:hypothetical protein